MVGRIIAGSALCTVIYLTAPLPFPAPAAETGLLLVLLCPADTTKDTCTPENARDSIGFSAPPTVDCEKAIKGLMVSSAQWPRMAPGDWYFFRCLRKPL